MVQEINFTLTEVAYLVKSTGAKNVKIKEIARNVITKIIITWKDKLANFVIKLKISSL